MAATQSKSPAAKNSARAPKGASVKAPTSRAKAAPGLRRKGTRVLGPDRTELQADLKAKYEAGASIRSLAQETGRSYGFVHKVLVESKTALRARGGAHTPEPELAKKNGSKKK
jgi:hypothetical protein